MPGTDHTHADASRGTDAEQTDVPPDAPECPYCGDAFPTERLRDLHRGLEHYDDLDEHEREAYEDAYRSEGEDLRSFRLRALAVLVLLYFGFLMTYAVVAT
ncbi:MAG: C2H2-type zinc finger protein [Halobacterium sp.]